MSAVRKVALVVGALVVLNVLGRVGSTRPGLIVEMFASWAVFGYLAWRAWPAVRVDVGRLRGVRIPGRLRGSEGRGGVF